MRASLKKKNDRGDQAEVGVVAGKERVFRTSAQNERGRLDTHR